MQEVQKRRRRELPTELKEEVVSLYRSGMARKDIAARFGLPYQNVYGIIQRWERDNIVEEKCVNVEDLDKGKVLALAKARWSVAKIADEMQVPPTVIAKVLWNNLKGDIREGSK